MYYKYQKTFKKNYLIYKKEKMVDIHSKKTQTFHEKMCHNSTYVKIYTKIFSIITFLIVYLQLIYVVSKNFIYKYLKYKNIKITKSIPCIDNIQTNNIYLQFIILLALYKINRSIFILFNKKETKKSSEEELYVILKYIKNMMDINYDKIHMEILYQYKSVSIIIDKNFKLSGKLYDTIVYVEKNKKLLEKNKSTINGIMTCANLLDKFQNLIYNLKYIFDKYSTNKIFNNSICNILLFNNIKMENGDILEIKIFGNKINETVFKSQKFEIDKIKNMTIFDLMNINQKTN